MYRLGKLERQSTLFGFGYVNQFRHTHFRCKSTALSDIRKSSVDFFLCIYTLFSTNKVDYLYVSAISY